MAEQDTTHRHIEDLPSAAELWPDAALAATLARMLAAIDRCMAELHRRPPWW